MLKKDIRFVQAVVGFNTHQFSHTDNTILLPTWCHTLEKVPLAKFNLTLFHSDLWALSPNTHLLIHAHQNAESESADMRGSLFTFSESVRPSWLWHGYNAFHYAIWSAFAHNLFGCCSKLLFRCCSDLTNVAHAHLSTHLCPIAEGNLTGLWMRDHPYASLLSELFVSRMASRGWIQALSFDAVRFPPDCCFFRILFRNSCLFWALLAPTPEENPYNYTARRPVPVEIFRSRLCPIRPREHYC